MLFAALFVAVFVVSIGAAMVWGRAFLELPLWSKLTVGLGILGILVALALAATWSLNGSAELP